MSTSVTPTPSAAKIEAYSVPMTPAPTTVRVLGMRGSRTMSSLVTIDTPSAAIPRGSRSGPHGDENVLRRYLPPAVSRAHHKRVRVQERGVAYDDFYPVAAELVFDHRRLLAHDVSHPFQQMIGVGRRLNPSAAQHSTIAREGQDRLADRLAGDRAGIETNSAYRAAFLDDRDSAAQLGGLNGGPLAGRPAADAHKVELVGGFHGVTLGGNRAAPAPVVSYCGKPFTYRMVCWQMSRSTRGAKP